MPTKGTIKTGEAFCMSCGAAVDAAASRCESCYSQLESDVRAFRCPRCGKVLELGTPECPKCTMKFKVKSVRPANAEEDEKILSRLIDWGRAPKGAPRPDEAPPPAQAPLTTDESEALSALARHLSELADLREEVAATIGRSLPDSRARTSKIVSAEPPSLPVDDLESELRSASEDLGRLNELLSRARSLSEEVRSVFSMPGPAKLAGDRGLSLEVPAGGSEGTAEEALAEREEQVRKREEMVDRKIKAYAQKKKELEAAEAAAPDNAEGQAGPAPEAGDRAEDLARRIRSVHELLSPEGACDDAEACLSSLEVHARTLASSRSELEQRVSQLEEGEEEVRTLLRALDGLLGQLPPEVVERFSKTPDFKLYERVLDRLRI